MRMVNVEIKKCNVVRTLRVPDFTGWYGRNMPDAKSVRFYEDRTTYTRGAMQIVFDLSGRAIEGWSYSTCMFCFAEPSEDYPQGRLIENESGYGSTTAKHVNNMFRYFYGDADVKITRIFYNRRTKVVGRQRWSQYDGTIQVFPVTRPTRAYYKALTHVAVNAQWHHRVDQRHWGYNVTPEDMRAFYEARNLRTQLTCSQCGVEIYRKHDDTLSDDEYTCEPCEHADCDPFYGCAS